MSDPEGLLLPMHRGGVCHDFFKGAVLEIVREAPWIRQEQTSQRIRSPEKIR